MITWHYRQSDHVIGPFSRETLDQLKMAGVIADATPVQSSSAPDWKPFSDLVVDERTPANQPADSARYYYIGDNRKPIGPFELSILKRLHAGGTIAEGTLVAGAGDSEWVPLAVLFGIHGIHPTPLGLKQRPAARNSAFPIHRTFDRFALLMGITLTLYTFYLVPLYSRDMMAITRKDRMGFAPLVIFGVMTCGLLLMVMMVVWAYDLEKHGNSVDTVGRQESLGSYVLVLNILAAIIALFSGGLALVVSLLLGAAAVWMIQKEINLSALTQERAF